jgi:hypothetical protein
MGFQTYGDLEIYQLSHGLAIEIHLKILYETGSLKGSAIFDSILQRYEELGRKIHNFIKAVESGHKS